MRSRRDVRLLRPNATPVGAALRHCRPAVLVYRSVRSLGFMLLATLGGCAATQFGFLNPAGPVARGERHLFMIVVIVLIFVIAPVLLLTPVFAWHYRLANTNNAFRPKWSFSWVLEFFIWIPPTAIVVGLAILLWPAARQFDPYTPLASTVAPLEVQAVGFDWKWLFIYPDSGIATINVLAIPTGRPVHLSLTSATVMQSMFVPQLAGQIYAMAGMTTQLNLAADLPGTYPGLNAQFNGKGFPQDKFKVLALPPADYDRWVNRVGATGAPLDPATIVRLLERTAEPQPLYFSAAPAGLFRQILDRSRSSAGMPDDPGPRP